MGCIRNPPTQGLLFNAPQAQSVLATPQVGHCWRSRKRAWQPDAWASLGSCSSATVQAQQVASPLEHQAKYSHQPELAHWHSYLDRAQLGHADLQSGPSQASVWQLGEAGHKKVPLQP